MFVPIREMNNNIKIIENDFGKPVETIMKCGDFKSNFARRLSNRFVVKPSDNNKRDIPEKLPLEQNEVDSSKEIVAAHNNMPSCREEDERAAAPDTVACDGDAAARAVPKPSPAPPPPAAAGATGGGPDMRRTEVAALNTEIEMLRWQLKQTEANRQMHIALLEQVVRFLSRVRVHMETQPYGALASPAPAHAHRLTTTVLQSSFSSAELPRSRSVFHVNTSSEVQSPAPASTRRVASGKMSKSVSNASGLHRPELRPELPRGQERLARHHGAVKDFSWKNFKLSFFEETNANKMILEELSRIIDLANTVLTTKLPHLTCCVDVTPQDQPECPTFAANNQHGDVLANSQKQSDDQTEAATAINNDRCQYTPFVLNTSDEWSNNYEGIINKYIESTDRTVEKYVVSPSPLTCGLEDDFASVTLSCVNETFNLNSTTLNDSGDTVSTNNKPQEKTSETVATCIEDESGFSSMNSFQEIGIPIINVTPPTPSKETTFAAEPANALPEEFDLDKQSMKVFWV